MLIEYKKVSDCFHCKYKWDCYSRRVAGENKPCKTLVEMVENVERYKQFLK